MSNELSVLAGAERDLAEIARVDPTLAESSHAATVLEMARQLDDPSNSATSKSMCARVLIETLEKLRALAPAPVEEDRLAAVREQFAGVAGS